MRVRPGFEVRLLGQRAVDLIPNSRCCSDCMTESAAPSSDAGRETSKAREATWSSGSGRSLTVTTQAWPTTRARGRPALEQCFEAICTCCADTIRSMASVTMATIMRAIGGSRVQSMAGKHFLHSRAPSACLLFVIAMACANATRATPGSPEAKDVVDVEILSASFTLGIADASTTKTIYSQDLLRFVDGDEARAADLIEGLLATRRLLSQASCDKNDPRSSRTLLRSSERQILHLAVFSLAYEFDRHPTGPAESASRQTLLILQALQERLETSTLLFPKFELLAPEEAVLVEDKDDGSLSLFPNYMEFLYVKSTANIELADKKDRISQKIADLSAAVSAIYMRDRVDDQSDLCTSIDVLSENAGDALLWATSNDSAGPGRTVDMRELRITAAITNHSSASTLTVAPWARAWVEGEGKRIEVIEVHDRLLIYETSIDNNIPPGVTRVRTFTGSSSLDGQRACAIELTARINAKTTAVSAVAPGCDKQRFVRRGAQSEHLVESRSTESAR